MSDKSPGLEGYTPTRIQWLVVMLNSLFQVRDIPRFSAFYVEADDGKSIILVVSYDADVNKEIIDQLINRAKDLVLVVAEEYGWDSWLEIKTDITIRNKKENETEQNDSPDE